MPVTRRTPKAELLRQLILDMLQLDGALRSRAEGMTAMHGKTAVLSSPAVVRLLGNSQLLADLGGRLALGELDLGPTELGHNLLRRIAFPRRSSTPF